MLRVSGEKKAETFREKLRIFKEKHTLLLLELLSEGKNTGSQRAQFS